MKQTMRVDKTYLRIATNSGAAEEKITILLNGREAELVLRPAVSEPDGCAYIRMPDGSSGVLEITGRVAPRFIGMVEEKPAFYAESFRFRPAFGKLLSLLKLQEEEEEYRLFYAHDPYGAGANSRVGQAVSRDLLHWREMEDAYCLFAEQAGEGTLTLRAGEAELYREEGKLFVRQTGKEGYASLPAEEKLRVWMRRWQDLYLQPGDDFSARLKIRSAPDAFPNIRLLPAEGISNEISTALLHIAAEIQVEKSGQAELYLAGVPLELDFYSKQVKAPGCAFPMGAAGSVLRLRLLLDGEAAGLYVNGVYASFQVKRQDEVKLAAKSRKLILNDLRVYGLRSLWLKPGEQK